MTEKQWHRFFINKISEYVAAFASADSCFIECGVKQGTSSAIMAKNLQRRGILFDTWKGPPHFSKIDAPTEGKQKRIKRRMNTKSTKHDCINNLKDNGVYDTCTLVEGDICETLPRFLRKSALLDICMMHIDTDVHAPAKAALHLLWPFIMEKGVVFLHDYGDDKRWPGIRILVDEFVGCNPNLNLYVFKPSLLKAAVITKDANPEVNHMLRALEDRK